MAQRYRPRPARELYPRDARHIECAYNVTRTSSIPEPISVLLSFSLSLRISLSLNTVKHGPLCRGRAPASNARIRHRRHALTKSMANGCHGDRGTSVRRVATEENSYVRGRVNCRGMEVCGAKAKTPNYKSALPRTAQVSGEAV